MGFSDPSLSHDQKSWSEGERVVAVVRLHQGATLSQDELLAFARDRLSTYKVPHQVEVVDELPRTGTEKEQRDESEEAADDLQGEMQSARAELADLNEWRANNPNSPDVKEIDEKITEARTQIAELSQAMAKFPRDFPETEKAALQAEARAIISGSIVPAYRDFAAFSERRMTPYPG